MFAFQQQEESAISVLQGQTCLAYCDHIWWQAPSPFPISYPGQHAQGTRSRQRQSELRVLVAHIYRYVAGALWPGALRSSAIIRDRIMGFINDTFAHLSNASLGEGSGTCASHVARCDHACNLESMVAWAWSSACDSLRWATQTCKEDTPYICRPLGTDKIASLALSGCWQQLSRSSGRLHALLPSTILVMPREGSHICCILSIG